jgi:urease accessory protein
VYVVGGAFDEAMTALSPDLESLSVLTGDRRVYLAVSDLPNQAGWAVRIAGSDGGMLRATVAAVTGLIGERACDSLPHTLKLQRSVNRAAKFSAPKDDA